MHNFFTEIYVNKMCESMSSNIAHPNVNYSGHMPKQQLQILLNCCSVVVCCVIIFFLKKSIRHRLKVSTFSHFLFKYILNGLVNIPGFQSVWGQVQGGAIQSPIYLCIYFTYIWHITKECYLVGLLYEAVKE